MMDRRLAVLVAAAGLAACASVAAPPPAASVAPAPPVVPIERKAGWILRLEQQRVLRDPAGPDLTALASDGDAGVRRRAVLAIGRAGLREGTRTVLGAISDPDEGVRAMAAFSLGLLGDPQGVAALEGALKDPSALVRGSAAQGLGLIGQPATAVAIANAAVGCPALIATIPSDEEAPQTPEVEACRLSIGALVRLRQFDATARVVLDANGEPVSRWWPVAIALQRSGDVRAAGALVTLASATGVYSPAAALRGLAALKDARVVPLALTAATRATGDVRVRAEAVRALALLGGAPVVPALVKILTDRTTPTVLAVELVRALGEIGDRRAFDLMLDLFASPSAAIRAAAMTSASKMDAEGFLLAVSSSERDRDWSVRANLAAVFATLPAGRVLAAVEELAADPDVRVQGPALDALARLGAPDADRRIADALRAPDFAVRATAASLVGDRRPAGGAALLAAAYLRGASDATHVARLAALRAIAKYPLADARETLSLALADPEWPVRLAAAALLAQAGASDVTVARPAPIRQDPLFFESDRLLRPAFTPHAYIETRAGTIQVELNMVDAPLTSLTFIELARAGFFDGLRVHRLIPNFVIQAGDPRGDGRGGPGYAIRDELSPLPFLRGTLGMAIDGADSAGSQFFIALSPQPHLEGRYTVFGRVVAGWEVLDDVAPGDVIDRVRIWDGSSGG